MSVQNIIRRLADEGALEVADKIASSYGVKLEDALTRRQPRFASARQEIWSVVRDTLAMSSPEMGALFERDHTTILEGIRRYRREAGLPL